ncbi:hypothetical protein [Streptomyces sp. NPDC058092]|uniref:hypothetical protein n=1 Tax=Streptomyces sp. NPDC058092 TaxID=3346336 RepID=UPI0036EFB0BA
MPADTGEVTLVMARRVEPGYEAAFEPWAKGILDNVATSAGRLGYGLFRSFGDDTPGSSSTVSGMRRPAGPGSSFHSDSAGRMGYHIVNAWGPYPMTSFQTAQFLQQGTARDDYMLALPGLKYSAAVFSRTADAMQMGKSLRGYRPGTSVKADWFAPVQHPSVVPLSACPFCRSDVGVTFQPALGGDSDPTHSLAFGLRRTWAFYRNGEQITDNTKVFVPERADYTLVSTDTRAADHGGVKLGGKVVTEYGFTSAAPKSMEAPGCTSAIPKATVCEALPVIQPHYRMNASLLNEVAAGTRSTVTVDASRAHGFTGGSRMAGAKFSVSYDDGATWKIADVDRVDENSFSARFTNAELSGSNGFVSIKAEAWDEPGNRTVQTVTRAYVLK